MDELKKVESVDPLESSLYRRDIMKIGIGAAAAMAIPLNSTAASEPRPMPPQEATRPDSDAPTGGLQRGQTVQQWPDIAESQAVVTSTSVGYTVHTGPGWVNSSGRAFGNGPMDVCTTRLVKFTSSFSESMLTPSLVETINYLMVDTLSALYVGFETDPARIGARLAQTQMMRDGAGCTVLGYGIKTTPEMAAFVNGSMIRLHDFNISPHNTETLGGILAIGELLHSTGPQVMMALTIAYEVLQAIENARPITSPGHVEYDANSVHAPGVALACGKLMGLNEDQLGNAVSLALLPHMPMYSRIGTQTMWKGCHSSEQVRNGVWAALLAREGMTGPCMPFEGRDGYIAHLGPFTRDFKLPFSPGGKMSLEASHANGGGYKHIPTDASLQNFYYGSIAPALIAWLKPEELERIDIDIPFGTWQEVCDAPKWDPRNFETADHSLPYMIARHLLDKQIYLDSKTKDKYSDPKARELMSKIFIHPITESGGSLKARKTSGEERVFKTGPQGPMTHDDLMAKYNKSVEFSNVDKPQADRILKQWMNLKDVKDINDAVASLAKFGNPRPLSDKIPSRYS